MLILEDKKISRKELADIFGVDLFKLEKQPSFEIDKSKVSKDKANGGVIKVNAGTSMRSRFYFEDPKTGVTKELRYAKSVNQENIGGKLQPKYSPHYVSYFKMLADGHQNANTKFSFQDDLDLAMYFYLHPQNKFSPLRSKRNKNTPVGYEFIDTKARALDKMKTLDMKAEAMSHAKNIDTFKMAILAKGLGFKRVDNTDEDTLRANLLEFANNKPSVYMDAVNSGVTMMEGLIVNLIDKGALQLDKIHGVRQWKWTLGDREGEIVGNQITNPTQDAKAAIKTYLLNNIHTYNVVINSITDNMKAKERAKEFFSASKSDDSGVNVIGDKLPEYLREVNQEVEDNPLPTSFAEARDYVEGRGYKKLPAKIKVFFDAVTSGEVTKDNVGHFLRELYTEEEG